MSPTRLALVGLFLAALLADSVRAQESDPAALRAAMIRRIDELVDARIKAAGHEPAARSSDEEFVRRVLSRPDGGDSARGRGAGVSGRRVAGQAGEADRPPARFAGTRHAPGQHLAEHHAAGRPQSRADQQRRRRAELAAAAVRREPAVRQSGLRVARGDRGRRAGPALYYTSLELAPEKLAGSTARIFLGLQIECAQCHDHPFDQWKQKDFWGYAAFFARLRQPDTNNPACGLQRWSICDEGEVKLPRHGGDRAAEVSRRAVRRRTDEAGTAPRATRDLDGLARQSVSAAGGRQPRLVASLRPRAWSSRSMTSGRRIRPAIPSCSQS